MWKHSLEEVKRFYELQETSRLIKVTDMTWSWKWKTKVHAGSMRLSAISRMSHQEIVFVSLRTSKMNNSDGQCHDWIKTRIFVPKHFKAKWTLARPPQWTYFIRRLFKFSHKFSHYNSKLGRIPHKKIYHSPISFSQKATQTKSKPISWRRFIRRFFQFPDLFLFIAEFTTKQ